MHTVESHQDEPLRETIFTAPFERRFLNGYRKLFSIKEIEDSVILHWVFGATLLTFFVTFHSWIRSYAITKEAFFQNTYLCWPYFQSCGEWYFLSMLPYGYTQTTLYMLLFGGMLLAAYLAWKKEWVLAHMLLLILLVWKTFAMFALTMYFNANYDYYHSIFTFVLLFLPYKYFFLKLAFVVLYVLSVTVKFHEGWILGSYFTTLQSGLPLLPDITAPLWTNIVIGMQAVGAWFLLSGNKVLQRLVLIYFVIFHLYSGILVTYRYPVTVLPTLLILFGPLYYQSVVPLTKKAVAGWIFIACMFGAQFISILIPGDEKWTLEGNFYGMYMFEANHQCRSTTVTHFTDGREESAVQDETISSSRCDPYRYWFYQKQRCVRDASIERISWTFDHSINSRPFYRMVDVDDLCTLEYQAFSHNEWIRTPEDGAEVVGYPVKNIFR